MINRRALTLAGSMYRGALGYQTDAMDSTQGTKAEGTAKTTSEVKIILKEVLST